MGPENSKVEGLDLYTADGEKIGKIHPLPELTVQAEEELASDVCLATAWLPMKISVKPAKNWRCRSRKRFIKLLMSKGISRNLAKSVARRARIAGMSYEKLWQISFFWCKRL